MKLLHIVAALALAAVASLPPSAWAEKPSPHRWAEVLGPALGEVPAPHSDFSDKVFTDFREAQDMAVKHKAPPSLWR